jgi:hypothetical protein
MWAMSTSFGPHTPEQWLALSQAMVRRARWRLHAALRPGHRRAVSGHDAGGRPQGEAALWQLYDRIHARRCCCAARSPTCCRGDRPGHDRARAPRPGWWSLKGWGMRPRLIAQDQVDVVASFLLNLSAGLAMKMAAVKIPPSTLGQASAQPTLPQVLAATAGALPEQQMPWHARAPLPSH